MSSSRTRLRGRGRCAFRQTIWHSRWLYRSGLYVLLIGVALLNPQVAWVKYSIRGGSGVSGRREYSGRDRYVAIRLLLFLLPVDDGTHAFFGMDGLPSLENGGDPPTRKGPVDQAPEIRISGLAGLTMRDFSSPPSSTRELTYIIQSSLRQQLADGFQFPPAFRGGLGICHLKSLNVSRTIWETISRAFSLSSAGTTYQGA